ncbi:MAG: hypothetical protein AAGM67_03025, partial [Bacteroidota bacterium]
FWAEIQIFTIQVLNKNHLIFSLSPQKRPPSKSRRDDSRPFVSRKGGTSPPGVGPLRLTLLPAV